MVKFVEENGAQNANTAAPATDAALGKINTAAPETKTTDYSVVFDRAFDWSSSSSMAGDFVRALNEAAEKNDKLRLFKYGVVEGISPEMGSAAFVAGDYNGSWLYGPHAGVFVCVGTHTGTMQIGHGHANMRQTRRLLPRVMQFQTAWHSRADEQ